MRQKVRVPVECRRTDVGELQSLRRAAAGVIGERSSGLSTSVKCDSKEDQIWSATIRAVAVLGYDNGDPASAAAVGIAAHQISNCYKQHSLQLIRLCA